MILSKVEGKILLIRNFNNDNVNLLLRILSINIILCYVVLL
jgi:hypothetical protein